MAISQATISRYPPSKRGLSWAWNNPESLFAIYQPAINAKKLTWIFNWEMWAPPLLPSTIEYVPQVRTEREAPQIEAFLTALHEQGKLHHFLSFNEPDIPSQANLSVPKAVILWHEYVRPAKAKFGFRLGSPGMSSAPGGKKWLLNFFTEIGEVASKEIEFINLHWYGPSVDTLKGYLEDMHQTFRRPLWLTEFAYTYLQTELPSPTESEAEEFLTKALPMLDACPYLERYAHFGTVRDVGNWVGMANNFVVGEVANQDAKLTRVGRIYTER